MTQNAKVQLLQFGERVGKKVHHLQIFKFQNHFDSSYFFKFVAEVVSPLAGTHCVVLCFAADCQPWPLACILSGTAQHPQNSAHLATLEFS
jgi:hypothetical protein